MNDTRVAGRATVGQAAGTVERTVRHGAIASASSGETVLWTHRFITQRGDRGLLVLLQGSHGLVMVRRIALPDGSVMEWTRSLRDAAALVDGLRGLTLVGDAEAAQRHLLRVAGECFSTMRGK